MDDLTARVRDTILTTRLLRPRDRVIVGVSGGPDSVALLHLLTSLKDEFHLQLSVVHVDHQLRPDSSSDAAFVEESAHRLTLPVTVIARHVLAEAQQRRLSLEEGAREIRYEVFREVAQRHMATRLALAHTADDQAETVMMRLLRGAGLRGLTAIPMTRSMGAVEIVRPLLGVWRTEILDYLQRQRLTFRQDATNADPRFVRNRIRAQLLPVLERDYNPNIKALLIQLADQCRVDVAFLHEAAQRTWKRLVKVKPGEVSIHREGLLKQPKALQRQLMRLVIQRLQGDLDRFEFRHWLEIERLFLERPVGTVLHLPGELHLERGRDRVIVRLPLSESKPQASPFPHGARAKLAPATPATLSE